MPYKNIIKQLEKNFDEFKFLELMDFDSRFEILNQLDKIFIEINKVKSSNSDKIIKKIKSSTIPKKINQYDITLFSLLIYFQKKYVLKNFELYLNFDSFQKIPQWENIKLKNKLSNFPHLIGVKPERDLEGKIVSKAKPRKFLDGVLHQTILVDFFDDFIIDFEKLEVLPWLWQTLVMPTYILPKSAINKYRTKLNADIVFVKRVFNSDKYAFHIVALKHESANDFTLISQFAIKKECFNRINVMFDMKKAYYDFYKSKKKAPISSG